MELRSRKKKELELNKSKQWIMAQPKSSLAWIAMKWSFLFVLSGLSLMLALVTIHNLTPIKLSGYAPNVVDRMSLSLGLQEYKHVVVIDAGSTGSRVLAFTFHRVLNDGTLKLSDELWHQEKPGLSSYADDPKKGAESINVLLNMAKDRIPAQYWSKTPLVLRATAGLRLLSPEKADNLLNEVRDVFSKSGFLVSKDSVSIMEGSDEGIFSWVTLNFLLDRLGGDPTRTVASLDLGGGSTQVTFVTTEKDSDTPNGYTMPLTMLGQHLTMYTHSYLGLGLMAAREQIIKHDVGTDGVSAKSPCVNPSVSAQWQYNKVTYNVAGSKDPKYKTVKETSRTVGEKIPIADYPECYKVVRGIVFNHVHRPKELVQRDVYGMSYYFDRAAEAGLIDLLKGGAVTVQKLLQTANNVCETPNADQPFACMDLTFIGSFLHDGLGLSPETVLHLHKKIDGHETSWGLGAGFHTITNSG